MRAIRALWQGEEPLPNSLLGYGLATTVVFLLSIRLTLQLSVHARPLPLRFLHPSLSVYITVVSVGICEARARFAGPSAYAIASRLFVLSRHRVRSSLLFSGATASSISRFDAQQATRWRDHRHDPGHPVAGFWKSDCANHYGFAIEVPASPSIQSSFADPAVASSGTYRPNTSSQTTRSTGSSTPTRLRS